MGNHAYFDRSPGTELENTGPFDNIQIFNYWSGSIPLGWSNGTLIDDDVAFAFNTGGASLWGLQGVSLRSNELNVWAVRDGDVGLAAIPLPASIWLFGSVLLILTKRRGKATLKV